MRSTTGAGAAYGSAGVTLRIADGSAWALCADGGLGRVALGRIAVAMRLVPAGLTGTRSIGPPGIPFSNQLFIDAQGAVYRRTADGSRIESAPAPAPPRARTRSGTPASPPPLASAPTPPFTRDAAPEAAVFSLLLTIPRELAALMEPRGILLLHGALIAREGRGVMLLGSHGAGKTTAALRVGPPWTALCDDAVLVVPHDGGFWAHPWPTWSALRADDPGGPDGPGGTWATQSAVRLEAVAHITHGETFALTTNGGGQTAVRLTEAAQALVSGESRAAGPDAPRRAANLLRFDTSCRIAARVPGFALSLNPDCDYWTPLGEALTGTAL